MVLFQLAALKDNNEKLTRHQKQRGFWCLVERQVSG